MQLTRNSPGPVSERDAAWFEELSGAVERGQGALLAHPRCGDSGTPSAVSDNALSLISLVDSGRAADSPECGNAVWRMLSQPQQPDAGESSLLLVALWRSGHALRTACAEAVHSSLNSLLDAQRRDGGWPASDPTGKRDPSCPAITARVLEALGCFGFRIGQPLVKSAVNFLLSVQHEGGLWPNTGQVLNGLRAVGFDMHSLPTRRAVRGLKESQNEDGGWGEGGPSTALQTADAMLGLFEADEWASPEVRAGAEFLVGTQRADGGWSEAPPSGGLRARELKPHFDSTCLALTALGRYLKQAAIRHSAEELVA
jgi:squalene-hopene/tetraprenyl-beta-curcumene cyclase